MGGKLGSGRQWWSWIHVEDLVAAVLQLLARALAAARPSPEAGALQGSLGRPAFFHLPAFAARLALGELADEGPLASTRVFPQKLLAHGFRFRYPELGGAFVDLLTSLGRLPV